jgi:hypothetical protein
MSRIERQRRRQTRGHPFDDRAQAGCCVRQLHQRPADAGIYRGSDGTRLAMLVFHDDAERECVCGPAEGLPNSKIGAFTQDLYDEAMKNGWIVISVKKDWKRIFTFD